MNDTIIVAIVSALSAISGVVASGLIQYLLAKSSAVREETRLRNENRRNRLDDGIVNILEITDPDVHPRPSVSEIAKEVIKLQLYLDLEDADQSKLNADLNELCIYASGDSNHENKLQILTYHSKVLDSARKILKKTRFS